MHLFVEKLVNIDFSYLDADRGLVGETWWTSVVLDGALDQQGMVCDFGTVKKVLRQWLDTEIDHRLLVPVRADGLKIQTQQGITSLSWQTGRGLIEMTAPEQAVTLIDAAVITPYTCAKWCMEQLTPLFPDTIEQLNLSFEPEVIDGPSYHYSHGLKKHDGNCQRIAHGHRSRIEIYLDGIRNKDEETWWADCWADIYLGSQEDIIEETPDQISYRYAAAQGDFALTLPRAHCYLMETDTTVELIAAHLTARVAERHPGRTVKVRAFEGVNKGALAFSGQ